MEIPIIPEASFLHQALNIQQTLEFIYPRKDGQTHCSSFCKRRALMEYAIRNLTNILV